jgi:hypothetical protein
VDVNKMLLKYVLTFPYFELFILNLYLRVLGKSIGYLRDFKTNINIGQKQCRQIPAQPKIQEATQDIDDTRAITDTDVPTETMALESGKRKVQGEEKGKDEGEGKQTPAMQHIQNTEQELPHDSKNSDTSNHTNDEPMAQEDLEPSQPDAEIHVETSIMSPKSSKKQKTDRDKTQTWDRTRSRSRYKLPRRM